MLSAELAARRAASRRFIFGGTERALAAIFLRRWVKGCLVNTPLRLDREGFELIPQFLDGINWILFARKLPRHSTHRDVLQPDQFFEKLLTHVRPLAKPDTVVCLDGRRLARHQKLLVRAGIQGGRFPPTALSSLCHRHGFSRCYQQRLIPGTYQCGAYSRARAKEADRLPKLIGFVM